MYVPGDRIGIESHVVVGHKEKAGLDFPCYPGYGEAAK